MEHERQMKEEEQDAQFLLARANRFNDLLTQNLAKLKTEEQSFKEMLPKITLEVEQLKQMRESLVSCVQTAIQEGIVREMIKLEETLGQSFLDTTAQGVKTQQQAVQESLKIYEEELNALKSSFEDYLDEERQKFKQFTENYHDGITQTFEQYSVKATAFKQDMETVVSTLKKLMILQKQRLTRKGILLCGVFCVASLLTGGLLFYLYPQHVYYPDKNVAKYMVMGKTLWENFSRLSPHDQDMLTKEVKKQMKK
ncbi:hypothetical protein Cva_01424 [Caedimonas varicaedens]|uniref:Uncharacterized protein n=1 Tax=Caedimonas varicaedens TaxID=1629334 RepID=A0A0K8MDZ8_9PROT|nr:hypothetical protein Cva_01424 [Caedimonas varicaedens]